MHRGLMWAVAVTVIALVGFFNHDIYAMDSTTVTVTPNPATLSAGSVSFLVKVNDTSSLPTTPTGNVTWSNNNSSGTFSPALCILSSGICTTSYTPAASFHGTLIITASYSGDTNHTASSGSSSLTVPLHGTTTIVAPNPSAVNSGSQVTFAATVADSSSLPTTPTGNVTWSSGNAGGTFNPVLCVLSSGSCTTSYTPSPTSSGTVTITASYVGDSAHLGSAGISSLAVHLLHRTTAAITPNPAKLSSNGTVPLVVQILDVSSSPTTPSGTVSWSDNNAGGRFNATSCTLTAGVCLSIYTAPTNPRNVITINATYSGDSTHLGSLISSQVSTNVFHGTATTITPNPATFTSGNPVTFTVTVADTSNPSAPLIGIVSWSDNGAGGTFSPNGCILSGNHCSLVYTPHSNPSTMITITANYVGDSSHSASSGMSSLSITTTSSPTPTPSSTYQIPNWIRNNAKWWHDNEIGDDDFIKGMQYLIQQGIMKIPQTQAGSSSSKQIPSWIKNNAGWWADGTISDVDFVKGIQYLIQVGIIQINH